jgi:hypothetical protein
LDIATNNNAENQQICPLPYGGKKRYSIYSIILKAMEYNKNIIEAIVSASLFLIINPKAQNNIIVMPIIGTKELTPLTVHNPNACTSQ